MGIAEFKKDTVYRKLRNSIIHGAYLHNHKFPRELDFSKELGVGKVTLRTALEKLEGEGLVARLPSRGTYVTYKKGHGGESGCVLLLTDESGGMENPYLYILPGLQERAAEISRRTTTCPARYLLSQSVPELRGMVCSNDIAGAVILGANFNGSEPLIGALKNMNIPVVIAHAVAGDREITGFATVRSDFRASWKTAIQHLAERGHEKVATLILGRAGKNIRDYSEDEYLGLLSSFGMDADRELILRADYDGKSVCREISAFFKKSGAKPTAILCYSDFMAIYLYETLKKMKIRVPQDIAVMGYCGYPGAALMSPTLSTVDFQYARIGAASLDLLAASDKWFGSDAVAAAPEIFIDHVLRERESSSIRRIEKNFKNGRGI
ncbi:MAG: GntR family transcriptional regulator, partial [Victivallales bacterium]|jgi:DNA-binding LacI/PurR family transcriptional regulator